MTGLRGERFAPHRLEAPIVQAPLAGGPSTPGLATAVSEAGGLGFLAAGYRPVDAVEADLDAVHRATRRPVGVNLFVPAHPAGAPGGRERDARAVAIERYASSLAGERERYGVAPGDACGLDDDGWHEKLALVEQREVAVASFTFGCPPRAVVERLQRAGTAVWVTVTGPDEAKAAVGTGADALVVQGIEAGGHRGTFDERAQGGIGLLALLQLVGAAFPGVPIVAAGGLATGRAVAAVLAAGAAAAQLGTAFMLAPEAGTSAPHRAALRRARPGATVLTRAFTGRPARGIANRFTGDHRDAPSGYPEIHRLTAPLRAAARAAGDADGINLWAGEAHPLATEEPAGEIVRRLAAEAAEALRGLPRPDDRPPGDERDA